MWKRAFPPLKTHQTPPHRHIDPDRWVVVCAVGRAVAAPGYSEAQRGFPWPCPATDAIYPAVVEGAAEEEVVVVALPWAMGAGAQYVRRLEHPPYR